jgi:PAS domain S-box-containing protein
VHHNPELATWLVARRRDIEAEMAQRLGPAAPRADAAEAEVLRRFRSFAAAALKRGTAAEPALDGIRANERRVAALPTRRVVAAAIDRVADMFLAVDADSGRIVDANPAAGALLGVARDALLDVEAMSFVPLTAQGVWWTHLDAVTEGSEPQRFSANLQDVSGMMIPVECTITRFATRSRTLALVLARPL